MVPVGTTAVGVYLLYPDGSLYVGNTLVATDVASVDAVNNGTRNLANVVRSDGSATIFDGSAVVASSTVPAGSKAIGAVYYLDPAGNLYYDGQVIATGVASADGLNNGSSNYASAVTTDGRRLEFTGGTPSGSSTVPVGSTAIGAYVLYPNGNLYYGGALVATDVASVDAINNGTRNLANVVRSGSCA
jgi:hypothetical protein